MTDWLLDIGNRYLNKERVAFVCRAMLYLVAIPILLAIFQTKGSKDIVKIALQISQLLYDISLAFLCLALMRLLYGDNYKIPTIGYYVVILTVKGVYLFFITSIGGKGEVYTLMFVLVLILHIVVGIQLLKTRYSVFGKAFIYYFCATIMAAIFSDVDSLSSIFMISAFGVLAYTFYKYLPTYYE